MRDSMNVTRRGAIKLGAGTVAAAAAVSLAACGGSSSSDSDSGSSASSSEQKSSYKVAIVISGPALDGGWGQGHYESLKKACEGHSKWEMLEPKENTAASDAAIAAQSYVDQDVDLVIAAGNEFASDWAEVVTEAAESHPDVHFLMTNTDPKTDLADYEDLSHLETVQVNLKQSGALAGVVAGLMTASNCIGFVGGMRLPDDPHQVLRLPCRRPEGQPVRQGRLQLRGRLHRCLRGRQAHRVLDWHRQRRRHVVRRLRR